MNRFTTGGKCAQPPLPSHAHCLPGANVQGSRQLSANRRAGRNERESVRPWIGRVSYVILGRSPRGFSGVTGKRGSAASLVVAEGGNNRRKAAPGRLYSKTGGEEAVSPEETARCRHWRDSCTRAVFLREWLQGRYVPWLSVTLGLGQRLLSHYNSEQSGSCSSTTAWPMFVHGIKRSNNVSIFYECKCAQYPSFYEVTFLCWCLRHLALQGKLRLLGSIVRFAYCVIVPDKMTDTIRQPNGPHFKSVVSDILGYVHTLRICSGISTPNSADL